MKFVTSNKYINGRKVFSSKRKKDEYRNNQEATLYDCLCQSTNLPVGKNKNTYKTFRLLSSKIKIAYFERKRPFLLRGNLIEKVFSAVQNNTQREKMRPSKFVNNCVTYKFIREFSWTWMALIGEVFTCFEKSKICFFDWKLLSLLSNYLYFPMVPLAFANTRKIATTTIPSGRLLLLSTKK